MHTLSGLLIHQMATALNRQRPGGRRMWNDGEYGTMESRGPAGWDPAQTPQLTGALCAIDWQTHFSPFLRTCQAPGTDSCSSKSARGWFKSQNTNWFIYSGSRPGSGLRAGCSNVGARPQRNSSTQGTKLKIRSCQVSKDWKQREADFLTRDFHPALEASWDMPCPRPSTAF